MSLIHPIMSWFKKDSGNNTMFKEFKVVGDITGELLITVPKGRTHDPLEEKKSEIIALLLKSVSRSYEELKIDTIIDLWVSLSFLGCVTIMERESKNVFSSHVMSTRVYDGSGDFVLLDKAEFALPLEKSQFTIDIKHQLGRADDVTHISMNVTGNVVLTSDELTVEQLRSMQMVDVLSSDTMKSYPAQHRSFLSRRQ